MKNIKKWLTVLAIGVSILLFGNSCSKNETLISVVSQSHSIVVNAQSYIQNVDSLTLVEQASKLEAPLKAVAVAMQFVAKRVDDSKINSELIELSDTLANISRAVTNLDPVKVEEMRVKVLEVLAKVENALVMVSNAIGDRVVKRSMPNPQVDDLIEMGDNLREYIEQAK